MAEEVALTFPCFGSVCGIWVLGPGRLGSAQAAAEEARRRLLSWHDRFTRFAPASELSRLNADPRGVVPASEIMVRFAEAVVDAGELTGGLVDATLLAELERAGYAEDRETSVPLPAALSRAGARRPARPSPTAAWREVSSDRAARLVTRPPGLRLDGGGLVKGLAADLLAGALSTHESFAVDCAGDLRVGGSLRAVQVAGPFDGEVLHVFALSDCAVATSGIGQRSWRGADGRPAHHLLDPATGGPAFTGIVQATALAPTALEAEMRSKAAVLSGPRGAAGWLPHGGLVVHDDGTHEVLRPRLAARGVPPVPA